MASNFLGETVYIEQPTSIISTNALLVREEVNLQKGMNFRDDHALLSVFLILPHEGFFKDEWDAESQMYIYEGHNSITVENGKSVDQLMMYESGRLSENGKFFKAANTYKDGIRKDPLQIQVYEKIDAGAWFDKGIFNLIDAKHVSEEERKVFKFHLIPSGARDGNAKKDPYWFERMIPATVKAEVWKRESGRCNECGGENGLRFVSSDWKEEDRRGTAEKIHLLCALHSGEKQKNGLLG